MENRFDVRVTDGAVHIGELAGPLTADDAVNLVANLLLVLSPAQRGLVLALVRETVADDVD